MNLKKKNKKKNSLFLLLFIMNHQEKAFRKQGNKEA
jgi:hypothetical protein